MYFWQENSLNIFAVRDKFKIFVFLTKMLKLMESCILIYESEEINIPPHVFIF